MALALCQSPLTEKEKGQPTAYRHNAIRWDGVFVKDRMKTNLETAPALQVAQWINADQPISLGDLRTGALLGQLVA